MRVFLACFSRLCSAVREQLNSSFANWSSSFIMAFVIREIVVDGKDGPAIRAVEFLLVNPPRLPAETESPSRTLPLSAGPFPLPCVQIPRHQASFASPQRSLP